jgi:hypothetical protein
MATKVYKVQQQRRCSNLIFRSSDQAYRSGDRETVRTNNGTAVYRIMCFEVAARENCRKGRTVLTAATGRESA